MISISLTSRLFLILAGTFAASMFFPIAAIGQTGIEAAPAISRDEREKAQLAGIAASINGNFPFSPMQEIQMRGGLPNIFAKLERGEPATIAYFGTSVTFPPGWRAMTFDWLQKQFPKAALKMVNASLGGTGSLVGAFRADKDLIATKPDLVFIEFAGNDNGDARAQPKEVLRAMEGIVRKIRHGNPSADICLAYAFGGGDFKTLLAGQCPRGSTLHEMIAGHYDLPSIQMSLDVAKLEQQGKLINFAPMTPDGLTPDGKIIFTVDGSHPTIPRGYEIWAGVVERALQQMRGVGKPGPHDLPPPLMSDNWEMAQTIPLEGHVHFEGQWDKLTAANGPACTVEKTSVYESAPIHYRTSTPGSSITLRFKGTHAGIKGMTGPDSGFVSIQADDKPPVKQCQFTVYTKNYSYGGRPLPEMEEGIHTVSWTFLDEKPDKQKILASYNRKGNDQDFIDHPDKYAHEAFYAGEILLVGEILPADEHQPKK